MDRATFLPVGAVPTDVATTPDGKVYRVDAAGKAEVVYDPHAKYIWALAFSKAGDLYVATGDQGEIHRVKISGSGAAAGGRPARQGRRLFSL